MQNQEFAREPVSANRLQPARYFAASYAGEHVAGTEFVIGAMFVTWGVGTSDILLGLLLGNLLAVLTWGLVCAPIAVNTRLTLYAYLEKIAGPGTIKLYSIVNGILFCVLAGTMITVSASAVRILFDIPPQVNWYPSNIGFVAVALLVGAVVVLVAAKGFKRVAQFAEVCAPWMILMFFAGALALLPSLASMTPGISSISNFSDFKVAADTFIWVSDVNSELSFWHVAAFAWVCNFAMHGGLSDMTVLRFARKASYGYFSALGMFIGHFAAWICAGIMGAGAGLLLQTSVTALDAGEVAYQALGAAGIIAVIIAGWTTSNPTIYRAGLAFQSINPKWDRVKVTIITGVVTTVIACFPFVFSKLMDFVSIMGLILAPVGAVIVTEHWILPKCNMTRYWSSYRKLYTNYAAIGAWGIALLVALLCFNLGVHQFFLIIPSWITATLSYLLLAKMSGASAFYEQAGQHEQSEAERIQSELQYWLKHTQQKNSTKVATGGTLTTVKWLSVFALLICALLAIGCAASMISLSQFKQYLIWPTVGYFILAILWAVSASKPGVQTAESESSRG
ncbi:nucleoside transporter [Neptunicella marina]|uniref:Nucleoside transporter n=1 Tax=Neptunicella marina TaxID=2125989 RepID=A0A8J6LX81_9ALTE|nr:nucleoside transporter [Neptunicella marina]MBC3765474.1 nucleoside transporter [Neptunicella marina]